MKTALSPEEQLRAAYAHIINGVEQHHIAALFGVNPGRVAEAVTKVRGSLGIQKLPTSEEKPNFGPGLPPPPPTHGRL